MKKDKKKFKMCINDERNYLISVVKNLTQDDQGIYIYKKQSTLLHS